MKLHHLRGRYPLPRAPVLPTLLRPARRTLSRASLSILQPTTIRGDTNIARLTADVRESGWAHEPGEGFLALVGGYWIRETCGQFCFGFRSSDIHRNRNNVVHGGMLLTFIDRAMGQTARLVTGATRSATITMNANFLAPMKLDAFATIAPSIVRQTKRMAFMEGKLMCDGQILIDVQGIWRVYSSSFSDA